MKKLLIVTLVIIGWQFTAGAQEKRDTIRATSKVAERVKLKNELGLTKQQEQKMKEINQEFKSGLQAIRHDSTLTQAQRQEKGRALMEDRKKKINEVLTPDQQAKYKQWSKEGDKRGKKKKGDKEKDDDKDEKNKEQ